MLTGFQVSTGAYSDENGELLCEDCFDRGDTYCRPVSNYELDEWQSARSEDLEHENEDCYCEEALFCDGCSGVLRDVFISPGCEGVYDDAD